jgi:hypothetical protein
MSKAAIRARLINDVTACAMGVTVVSAGDVVTALAKKLVRDGWDADLPMVVWKADKPWRRVEHIGEPYQVRLQRGKKS